MSIVSDRGGQFVSGFWEEFTTLLGVRLRRTSAHQPSTDGLVERFNQVVGEMLRHFVSPMHDDCDEFLDCAEFPFNKSYRTSLKCSPWEFVHPLQPLSPPEYELVKGLPVHKSPAGRKALSRWLLQYANAKECLHLAKEAAENREAQKRSHRSVTPGEYVMVSLESIF
jgi:transposase InsO family protein